MPRTSVCQCIRHSYSPLPCSELHSRCCVQPASELMGLALREVLPLAWQQEWRREQGERVGLH